MKVTRVVAVARSRQRAHPVRDALQLLDTHGECLVTVETSDGISGTGAISFGRIDSAPSILAHLINDELAPAVVGVGLMADAFNVSYASHGGGVHLHVLAALPNTLFMESGLLPDDSPVHLVDGCYLLPEAPGFGQADPSGMPWR